MSATIFEKDTAMDEAQAESFHELAKATLLGTRVRSVMWALFATICVASFFAAVWLPLWGYDTRNQVMLSLLAMVVAYVIKPSQVEVDLHGNRDNS